MKEYSDEFNDLRSSDYVIANLTYTDNEGKLYFDKVGLRTRGNTSRVLIENDNGSLNMSHFKIKFNYYFGDDDESKVYDVVKDRLAFSQEEINLKFNRNWDESYISEKFSYDLLREGGITAPRSSLTKLSIKIGDDLVYYGIYTIVEPIDKLFLINRYGKEGAKGNLYKSLWQSYGPANLTDDYPRSAIGIKDVSRNYRPSYDLKTNKKEHDYSDIKNFIKQINSLQGVEFINYIEEHFEVDLFIRYLAMNVLIGNPDDYRSMGNNYYLYHNNKTDKFEFIPYDYDHSLGQGWDGGPAFTNYTIGADIYDWPNLNVHINPGGSNEHPLSDKILSIRKYRDLYTEYLSQFIDKENNIFQFSEFYQTYRLQKRIYEDDELYTALFNLEFGLRNAKWYFNEKIANIEDQLN